MSEFIDILDGVDNWNKLHERLALLSKPTRKGQRDGGQGRFFE